MMIIKRILLLLSLCVVTAGCSDKSSQTIEPTPQPLVRQIRITMAGSTTVHDFIYDVKQRISRHTIASTNPFSFQTIDYTHSLNKTYVTVTSDTQTKQYSIRRNDDGSVDSVVGEGADNKFSATYSYNNNGYLYQQPSKGPWSSYEYRMSGERCNLERIIGYAAGGVEDQQQIIKLTTFEYGFVKNVANLDFSYISLMPTEDYTCTPVPLKLFGWVGKRSYNLPKTMTWNSAGGEVLNTIPYQYTIDSNGLITQIVEENTSYTPTQTLNYDIRYYNSGE